MERVIEEHVVPARRAATGTVRAGQVLRITDVHGGQVADFCSFNRHDPAEHCDVVYTTLHAERWRLGLGDVLRTRDMRPLWTIVADTNGVHYSGGDFCSGPLQRVFEGNPDPAARGCREILEEAIAPFGLTPLHLSAVSCFNVFMRVDYGADGSMRILDPTTRPGDHVELRAEMDALWAASVCPGAKANTAAGELRFTLLQRD